ncbi:MAG TPA: 2-phosphosulfolactate phosphatase [Bacteroidales bacterium]|nr:2-phosphosulfolactate phosphatase [Bacteroidales bacterium]
MLPISVRALPTEVSTFAGKSKAVAIIDVLRATTVMATALHNGAQCIYTRAEIEDARRLKAELGPEVLLCGERQGKRIMGFDLGNSPFEFGEQTVKGKILVMCTTNGTRAVEAGLDAGMLVALSFVNLSAVAKMLLERDLPVELLCAGTNGRFSLDDALCAGMVIAWLNAHTRVQIDDLGRVLLQLALQEGSITHKLRDCSHKIFLESSGFGADVQYCLEQDRLDTIPVLSHRGCFVPYRS